MPPVGEVILLGCGLHFEIWSKQNYEAIPRDQDDDDLGIL
jgi:DNA-binding transcriptional regulator/RsmH inhibitor MraZ